MTVTDSFTDKVVFITGAGAGIGRATALTFAEAGADVAVSGLNEESLHETAGLVEARGRRAHVVTCDVASGPAVEAAVTSTVDTLGRLDFAINNAGIEQPPTPLAETTDAGWDRIITVDLRGVFLSMKHEILAMGEADGSIVNISSGAGVIGIRGQGASRFSTLEAARARSPVASPDSESTSPESTRGGLDCPGAPQGWRGARPLDPRRGHRRSRPRGGPRCHDRQRRPGLHH